MIPVIDLHAHVFPPNVFTKIWAYFDEHHWPIHYRQGEDERAAFLDTHTEAYTTLCYAHRGGMAAWLNDYALRYAAGHPKAIATGTFHPDDPDVLDYVRGGIERGFKGFKLHLEVQKFDPADARLAKVYALLQEAGSILHVHTAGAPLEGPWTGPAHFRRMLALAPKLRMIVAHLGGSNFPEYWALGGDHPLWFDTAMVGVEYKGFGRLPPALCEFIAAHPDRFVFGSDYPSIPYPWEDQVAVVRSWNLGAGGEAMVLHGNARGLYGLGERMENGE